MAEMTDFSTNEATVELAAHAITCRPGDTISLGLDRERKRSLYRHRRPWKIESKHFEARGIFDGHRDLSAPGSHNKSTGAIRCQRLLEAMAPVADELTRQIDAGNALGLSVHLTRSADGDRVHATVVTTKYPTNYPND